METIDTVKIWERCKRRLQDELSSQHFNTWIKPLQLTTSSHSIFTLLAPNGFVVDWVIDKYQDRINQLIIEFTNDTRIFVNITVGTQEAKPIQRQVTHQTNSVTNANQSTSTNQQYKSSLNPEFRLDNYVEGKANQLAKAAAIQVAENPGGSYNPFFLYGGTGLGKTHLMQAVGNAVLAKNKEARVVYLHSERFVADMVKALQTNAIDSFKKYYRSIDVLLIDDFYTV